MSTVGGGEILLVPAAAGVAVAGAALLAVAGVAAVGGVAVYQTGKGVVACGRKVNEAIQAHVAQQQAINEMCARLEEQTRRAVVEGPTMAQALAASRQKHAALLGRLRSYRQQAETPPPQPALPLPPEPTVEAAPPPSFAVVNKITLREEADALAGEMTRTSALLDSLAQPAWQGLVTVDDLQQELALLEQRLAENREIEGEVGPDNTVRALREQLRQLQAEIAWRSQEGRKRQEQRQQTTETMTRAAEELEAALADEEATRFRPLLDLATDSLAQAEGYFQAGELAAAQEMASGVLGHLARREEALGALRASNLEMAIASLQEHVDDYDFPSESEDPRPIRQALASAAQHLAEDRLDEAWEMIQEGQRQAELLAQTIQKRQLLEQQTISIEMIEETLADMGYRVTEDLEAGPAAMAFRAQREDGAYFLVWVTDEGFLQFKAENFGDEECAMETQHLFEKLQERGMIIRGRARFNMQEVAEKLRELMVRGGYTWVQQEQTEEGIILSAQGGEETRREKVGYDATLAETMGGEREENVMEQDVQRRREVQKRQEDYRRQLLQANRRRLKS